MITNYERATALLAEIDRQTKAGSLFGEGLEKALQLADLYTRMAQVDATHEQTELIKAMKRHPAGRKRNPEPRPAPSPVNNLAVLRPHGGH